MGWGAKPKYNRPARMNIFSILFSSNKLIRHDEQTPQRINNGSILISIKISLLQRGRALEPETGTGC